MRALDDRTPRRRQSQQGLPPYELPASFTSLTPDKQLLILTDLDRSAYDITPVYGLNSNLTEAAQTGVREQRDPTTPTTGGPWKGYGSDWASTAALIGYYLWMYDDGYGSPNGDCTSPSATGCWGHRKVILGEAVNLPTPQLMGAATGTTPRNAGTALIISANNTTTSNYTWTQAQQEGAGQETEPPAKTTPQEGPATPPASGATTSSEAAGPPPSAIADAGLLSASGSPSARIADLLDARLSFSPGAARIGAILRHGGVTLTLPRGLHGTFVVDYYLRSTRRLLIARGTRRLGATGHTVAVTLTRAGRYVLRHRGRVALLARARLASAGSPAISVSRTLLLTR